MYGEAMLAEKYRLGHFNKMPYININWWQANPRTKNNCLSPGITLIRSKLLIPKNNQQDFKKLLLRMTHRECIRSNHFCQFLLYGEPSFFHLSNNDFLKLDLFSKTHPVPTGQYKNKNLILCTKSTNFVYQPVRL